MSSSRTRTRERAALAATATLLVLCRWSDVGHATRKVISLPEAQKVFELEIPELSIGPTSEPQITIPTTNLSLLLIHVLREQADLIDYGKIFTLVNGEATATIQEISAGERGKLVRIFLTRRPGFNLMWGRNAVEIRATNRRGRSFYSSFVLRTVTENRNQEFQFSVELGQDQKNRTPPELIILEPEHEVEVLPGRGAQRIRIDGVATAANRIERVIVNGESIPLKGGSTVRLRALGLVNEGNRVAFETIVTVSQEIRSIGVEAVDLSHNKVRIEIPVRVREVSVASEFHGRKFALIIGISKFRYHEGGLNDLRYADIDAQSLYKFLQSPAGGRFSVENMLLLINEQASLAHFQVALSSFLARAAPDDLLLIFLASHGSPDPYAPQSLYFLLHDTRVDQMPETALAMTDLQKMLQQYLRARRLVLLVDTCHSAGLTGAQGEMSRGVSNNLVNLYTERLLYREEGKAVITSSDVNETSQEASRWGGGHGVFTHFLLEGLQGKADANGDHLVTVGELFRYVRQKVRWETQFRQNPRALAGTNESLVIAAAASAAIN